MIASKRESFTVLSILARPVPVAILVIIATVALLLHRVLADPLRSIPGPLLARFTRLWELWQQSRGDFEKTNLKLHQQYGPVFRIAPGRYSINDRSAVKPIYGHGSKFYKSKFYHPFSDPSGRAVNLFAELDNRQHSVDRRKVASLYSMSTMLSYEQYVDSCNELLCQKLALFAETKQPLDIPTWMQYYAFDVIGEITVGQSFGMMERGYDSMGILEAIDKLTRTASYTGLVPELFPWLVRAAKMLSLPVPVRPVLDFAFDRIAERKAGKTDSNRDDFLTKVLNLREAGTIDDRDLLGTIGANIAAGSDTTAISLSSTIYNLLQHPDYAQKLQQEIDDSAQQGKMSDPVTFKEAQEMPYLQAVLKESLRVHPATGQVMARIVPPGGAQVSGYFFPGGTCVGANSWSIHYNKDIFGPDAEQFRPDRWLGSPEDVAIMNECFFAFGSGSRTCLGKNISLLEMSKVIPQIYRKFEIGHADPASPKQWKTRNHWFVKQEFECRLAVRA